jgi:hypothetical protein
MKATTAKFEDWMIAAEPSVYTFASAVKLAGLEDRFLRISAADQRRLLGASVFGKKTVRVNSDPSKHWAKAPVEVSWTTSFGHDYEVVFLFWDEVKGRVAQVNRGETLRW